MEVCPGLCSSPQISPWQGHCSTLQNLRNSLLKLLELCWNSLEDSSLLTSALSSYWIQFAQQNSSSLLVSGVYQLLGRCTMLILSL